MYNLNTYFDKIYYLNLDKDVDRNESILSQFKKWDITNFERVSGVVLNEKPNPYLYRNYIKASHKYILGSFGCASAHLKAVQDAKHHGYKRILILEDDIEILKNPHETLSNSSHRKDWDMLYFGGMIEPHFRGQIVCAHAYGLSQRILDDIIYMALLSGMEIDNFYAKILQHMSYNHSSTGKYITEIVNPFNTIVQKRFYSNIKEGF